MEIRFEHGLEKESGFKIGNDHCREELELPCGKDSRKRLMDAEYMGEFYL